MLLYDISVHMYFPNTMHTPGYDVEMLTKPAITAKIEEGDTPITPANAAKALLKGENTHLCLRPVTKKRSENLCI